MTADDKLEIRMFLAERLEFLQGRDLRIEVSNHPDVSDYAAMVAEVDCNVALREREARELGEVMGALGRLNDPGFGMCEECGEFIGAARLKARPQASRCIRCQTMMEQAA